MADVLIVEDNETLREGIVDVVQGMDHSVVEVSNGQEGLKHFEENSPEIVISDLKMDKMDGMELLSEITECSEDAMVMIITAFGSIEKAVDAMKEGAFDFIPKPFPPDLLRAKVDKALSVLERQDEVDRLTRENEALKRDAEAQYSGEIVGQSDPMEEIFQKIEKVAPTESAVLIEGESGTGKELVARAIHRESERSDGPFVRVNCAALSENLLESELFGHEKGAFTGAHKQKLGRFELADGGTILLDEIGEIGQDMQVKLLRVLQEHSFQRVGGEERIEVDVRVVASTNKTLSEEVDAGRFREDLFYRLHIIPIDLPPLRDRKDDIQILAEHFVDKLGKRTRSEIDSITSEAMEMLKMYDWPGNVRELENAIEHAMVFADGSAIDVSDLPPVVTGMETDVEESLDYEDRPLPEIMDAFEKRLIEKAYDEADGVKTETASKLGIKTSALYYKLDKHDIE
jgi:two-component system response regulator HydG